MSQLRRGVFLLCVFLLSLDIRRLHDIGKPGWWVVPLLIFGPLSLLYLWFKKGQRTVNKYGKPPKPRIEIKALMGLASRSD